MAERTLSRAEVLVEAALDAGLLDLADAAIAALDDVDGDSDAEPDDEDFDAWRAPADYNWYVAESGSLRVVEVCRCCGHHAACDPIML